MLASSSRHRSKAATEGASPGPGAALPRPEPRALSEEVDFALDEMLAARILPRLQRPVLVNVVRSPGYVPVRYLALLECRTLRTLSKVYGAFEVSHEGRVDVTRTGCDGFRARRVDA